MGPPEVVRASVADAGTVGRLLFDFNTEFDTPGPSSAEFRGRFVALLENDDVIVLLAGSREDPAGFAFLTLRPSPYYDGPLAQLEELYVRPQLRGQGFGSVLLVTAMQMVRERSGGEIQINVDEIDTDARRFYERHGFVNIEPGVDYRMLCYIQEL